MEFNKGSLVDSNKTAKSEVVTQILFVHKSVAYIVQAFVKLQWT